MLAASSHFNSPTAAMGVSQQENSYGQSELAQGVYLTFSPNARMTRNDSESSGDTALEKSDSASVSTNSSLEGSPVPFFAERRREDSVCVAPESDEGQEDDSAIDVLLVRKEPETPSAKPKYGTVIIGLPDKLVAESKLEKGKKPKKKKWKAVNVEDMGFKLSLFPRVPVTVEHADLEKDLECFEAELNDMNLKVQPFCHVQELEELGPVEKKFIRRDKHRKEQKAHRQVKTKHITSIGVHNNRGRKTLYIHFRLYKMVELLQCQYREHPNQPGPPKKEGVYLGAAKGATKRQVYAENLERRLARGPSKRDSHGDPPQSLAHALDNGNADDELPTELISFLITLQHREMTPEDYDMLLRLDEGVAPKTVNTDIISNFKTDVVDETTAGEVCSVCMEVYELGQERKFLPCDHVFHVECIDMWLSNSSQNCPLDGLPVGDS